MKEVETNFADPTSPRGLFDWAVFDNGRAKFCGFQRDTEVGSRAVFAVESEHGRPFYGEFDLRYEPDGTRYNVEVLSFGYADKISVGLPAPTARAAFSVDEGTRIRELVKLLMLSNSKKPFPMSDRENFFGEVFFAEGWIREEGAW